MPLPTCGFKALGPKRTTHYNNVFMNVSNHFYVHVRKFVIPLWMARKLYVNHQCKCVDRRSRRVLRSIGAAKGVSCQSYNCPNSAPSQRPWLLEKHVWETHSSLWWGNNDCVMVSILLQSLCPLFLFIFYFFKEIEKKQHIFLWICRFSIFLQSFTIVSLEQPCYT